MYLILFTSIHPSCHAAAASDRVMWWWWSSDQRRGPKNGGGGVRQRYIMGAFHLIHPSIQSAQLSGLCSLPLSSERHWLNGLCTAVVMAYNYPIHTLVWYFSGTICLGRSLGLGSNELGTGEYYWGQDDNQLVLIVSLRACCEEEEKGNATDNESGVEKTKKRLKCIVFVAFSSSSSAAAAMNFFLWIMQPLLALIDSFCYCRFDLP